MMSREIMSKSIKHNIENRQNREEMVEIVEIIQIMRHEQIHEQNLQNDLDYEQTVLTKYVKAIKTSKTLVLHLSSAQNPSCPKFPSLKYHKFMIPEILRTLINAQKHLIYQLIELFNPINKCYTLRFDQQPITI